MQKHISLSIFLRSQPKTTKEAYKLYIQVVNRPLDVYKHTYIQIVEEPPLEDNPVTILSLFISFSLLLSLSLPLFYGQCFLYSQRYYYGSLIQDEYVLTKSLKSGSEKTKTILLPMTEDEMEVQLQMQAKAHLHQKRKKIYRSKIKIWILFTFLVKYEYYGFIIL